MQDTLKVLTSNIDKFEITETRKWSKSLFLLAIFLLLGNLKDNSATMLKWRLEPSASELIVPTSEIVIKTLHSIVYIIPLD